MVTNFKKTLKEVLIMAINFFKHDSIAPINEQLKSLTQTLRTGDTIKAIHTPIVFPLNTSNEIGGYARSLNFIFNKYIAIDCNRFMEETPSMKEFILSRQIALFDKSSRCLHLPLAAASVAIAVIASSILFPSSILAAVTIPSVVGLASALIIAKRERENELYADLMAFRNCEIEGKNNVLYQFFDKAHYPATEKEEALGRYIRIERSPISQVFSGYPLNITRFRQLNQEMNRQKESVTPEDKTLINENQASWVDRK